MKCLCCGKEINNSSIEEIQNKWHNICIKRFFGVKEIPNIDVNDEKLFQIAIENSNKGLTVPGVQKKLSLYLINDQSPKLTVVNYPTGYILKPQTKEYELLPECEYLVMQMANVTKIKTVPFALIEINKETKELAYITKRIDRVNLKSNLKAKANINIINKLAMEDFCQLDNKLTEDKYKGSYERCSKIIDKYSSNEGLDNADLFLRIAFSFVVGNSDMHLKNFSLIETSLDSNLYHLSDAYDMLPVNVIMPNDIEELALTLNGKNRNLRRNDFIKFGKYIGLNRKSIEKMLDKIISLKETYIKLCEESYLTEELKERFINLINNRISRISNT